MLRDDIQSWCVSESEELYEINRWGKGYFSISHNGDVLVHPDRSAEKAVVLKKLVDDLKVRGLATPILFRFNDILRDRLDEIQSAFRQAIDEHSYDGVYCCVYPIKVNQQRHVVEQVLKHGRPHGFGIEAGSKPELMAVVAIADPDTPIICNGFKDREFVELALMAQKMGRRIVVVVEKFTDLKLIVEVAREVEVRPSIGVRVKLAARGSGRWKSSGGYRSKFGLTVAEILHALKYLEEHQMQDCLNLLHFHLGSQITNIRHIKTALTEAARIYADLHVRCGGLTFLDVGGGLGVDYDGTQTDFESSMNYSLQEYANDVIYHVQSVCQAANVPPPNIISESGRAVTAYHSVLVFDVLGVSSPLAESPPTDLADDVSQPVKLLFETLRGISVRNLQECYHDAQQAFEMATTAFAAGYISLDQRSIAEKLYWAICNRVRQLTAELEFVPTEIRSLDSLLANTYFCNFSLFQSLPDSWAIKQLFPIMPIHRLDEQPSHPAVLGDITCDSDGKIDKFVDRRDISRTLLLHEPTDQYFLGAFLVGAYQEILGDLHNLFGDTNAVHISISSDGNPIVESVVKGDTVKEVLHYVQYNDEDLLEKMQASVEDAVQRESFDHEEAGRFLKFYEAGLRGYTYLE